MLLMTAVAGDFWKTAFETSSKVSSGFALGAFVAVAVIATIWITKSKIERQPVPLGAWIILGLAISIPILANVITTLSPASAVHHITVLVLDKGAPQTDLQVVNTINVPSKKDGKRF